jgi:hypothetical protein
METEVLEETTYYRIESPRGVMSDHLGERELEYYKEQGYFTLMFWAEQGDELVTKRYKVGKIHKYTRKITLSEEVLA